MIYKYIKRNRHPLNSIDLRYGCNAMWIFIISFLFILLASSAVFAQMAGKISGRVVDAQTGEPLIGANVIIVGTSMGAATDIDGNYFVINVPPGKYDIQASMVGYEKIIQKGVVVNSGKTTVAEFKLKVSAIEQEPIIVEAVKPDVEPEKTSTSVVFRPEDVQNIAGTRSVNDAIALAADVIDGHFRGGRPGEQLYVLQGFGITNPLDNTIAIVPMISALEEVEIVTSGFGAQYGNAQSGVVNITMKEGRADAWHSYAEVNTRVPGRKYFGAHVYDANANRYLQTMLTDSVWNAPSNEIPGFGYWTGMGKNISTMFGKDTAAQIALAKALWREVRKKINDLSYDNNVDYSVEFSTGGPLSESARMFLAARKSNVWPRLPAEEPDIDQQIMGNVAFDMGKGTTFRVSGAYSVNSRTVFPSENSPTSPGYLNFLWDNILNVQYRRTTNTQLGIRFNKVLSPKTYYEIKLNALLTKRREGSSPFEEDRDDLTTSFRLQNTLTLQQTPPDGFVTGAGRDNFYNDKTSTYSLDAYVTSQVAKSHLINAGVQANIYRLDIKDHYSLSGEFPIYSEYTAKPYEVALYTQDKIEFQGMIANVGLRLDFWDLNTKFLPDLYAPYLAFLSDSNKWVYVGKDALTQKIPKISRLQPRIGVSFPILEQTVFHFNYGAYVQRPGFQYIFESRNLISTTTGKIELSPQVLGNPYLRPQTTYSYDVGVVQGFGEGFTLDISGYYKNVLDLIQQAQISSECGSYYPSYNTYINRAYADIRGFKIILSKRKGPYTGSINYQYSVATGKSSSVGSMVPTFHRDQNGLITLNAENTAKKDILLDFDREHNFLIDLGYTTESDFGFKAGGIYPLGDITVYLHSYIRSGRPYTYSSKAGEFEVNNKRTPWERNTDVKISKKIKKFFGTTATIYLEIFNLFNDKTLNYDYIFRSDNAGSPNPNAGIYENVPLDAPNGLLHMNDKYPASLQLALDKSFLIYTNEPRSFNLGFTVEF